MIEEESFNYYNLQSLLKNQKLFFLIDAQNQIKSLQFQLNINLKLLNKILI